MTHPEMKPAIGLGLFTYACTLFGIWAASRTLIASQNEFLFGLTTLQFLSLVWLVYIGLEKAWRT